MFVYFALPFSFFLRAENFSPYKCLRIIAKVPIPCDILEN